MQCVLTFAFVPTACNAKHVLHGSLPPLWVQVSCAAAGHVPQHTQDVMAECQPAFHSA